MPVVIRSGDAFARVEPHARQRLEALGRRHRHHQVAPDEADGVLHTALLMAGIRVAEPRLEPVMRAEQGEQAGLGGRAVRPAMAHAGGVVEHHHPRRHAHALEDPRQTLAHALRGLAGKGDHPAHVRIRERHHREMHHAFDSGDHGPGLAEIDLRASRRPLQLGEAVRLHAMLPPPALDPALHRRIRAREPHSATSRSYTRVAVWRCLTGMRRSAVSHPSTTAEYSASASDLPACPEPRGLGE